METGIVKILTAPVHEFLHDHRVFGAVIMHASQPHAARRTTAGEQRCERDRRFATGKRQAGRTSSFASGTSPS
jgi:hypothetical protein